jgi:hypothetical protein
MQSFIREMDDSRGPSIRPADAGLTQGHSTLVEVNGLPPLDRELGVER